LIWCNGWFGAVVEDAKKFSLRPFFIGLEDGGEGWVAEETARPKNSRVGKPSRLRERAKRDFSTAQTDTFAGAKVEEKASVCFGRNDKVAKFVEMLGGTARNDKFAEMLDGWTTWIETEGEPWIQMGA
jgi:hypothetical protein